MKKTSIYLDTSVINFLFADDAPEKRDITIEFFEDYIKNNIYDIYVSVVVIDEINKTKDEETRNKLLNVIKTFNLSVLDIDEKINNEVEHLARMYINNKIIPVNKIEDALHIALCTVYEIDILLSWNYRHLANFNKERKIISVNIDQGYMKEIRMITPMEVIDE